MRAIWCSLPAKACAVLLVYAVISPAQADKLAETLMQGKASLDLRYRYETVEEDNPLEDATASTIRTRLGYSTAEYANFSAYIEMEDVHRLIEDDYSTPAAASLGPKAAMTSVVADPIGTELNQSYLQYQSDKLLFKYGRQSIVRGNHRFIGDVAWRQNQQTYDAIVIEDFSSKHWRVHLSQLNRRNTVLFTDEEHDSTLFDMLYQPSSKDQLMLYYYDIEVENNSSAQKNTGLRYDADRGPLKFSVEFARQETATGAEPEYSLIELSYGNQTTFTIGVETLGMDTNNLGNAEGFSTPLATLHKFNGWADVFLNTPSEGLEDSYIRLQGKAAEIDLQLVYHQFVPDGVGDDYGTEVDLQAKIKFGDYYSAGLKVASYRADAFAVDTDKVWLFLGAKF